jgi:hypothetical protein
VYVSKQRSTFGKRDRERAKAAKAAAKRERRVNRADDEPATAVAVDDDDATDAELVERLEQLHAAFDDGRLSFEDFDSQRAQLVDRIAARMSG